MSEREIEMMVYLMGLYLNSIINADDFEVSCKIAHEIRETK